MNNIIFLFSLCFITISSLFLNHSENTIEQECIKPPNPQSTIDNRYLPKIDDPVKKLRVNLVFLHRPENKAKGIEASKEKSPEYQAYIDKVINYMDFQLANFLYEETPNQCSETRIDSKIRFDIKKVFIDNAFYWNNENDSCNTGCPYLRNCNWYAKELADSLNAGLNEDEKRINVFFTENEKYYNQVLKAPLPKGTKYGGDCSMGYQTDLTVDARIHMRNEFIKFQEMRWYSINENTPMETVMKWAYVGFARVLVHEIGHTIFGSGHTNNNCNIMSKKSHDTKEHLQAQQLQEAHRALSTHNMRKYVAISDGLSHAYIAKKNELINYDLQLWGNLVVPENSTLTISCTLRMPPNSKIVLKKGAELVIDGGKILPAFKNTNWKGIDTGNKPSWFSKLFNKSANNSAGKFSVINGGEIIYSS